MGELLFYPSIQSNTRLMCSRLRDARAAAPRITIIQSTQPAGPAARLCGDQRIASSNHNQKRSLCIFEVFKYPHILGKLPHGLRFPAYPNFGHADSRVLAQTPFTSYIKTIHKPTRSGCTHDGLRATSSTFVRPASARAAHAGLLQCATKSNYYVAP